MADDARSLEALEALCGLGSLGSDAPPEAIQATAENVAELRRSGELSRIEEAMLRDGATKAWKEAGYRAPVELWKSTEPGPGAREEDEEPAEPEKTVEELYEEGQEVLEAEDQLALFREEIRDLGYAGRTDAAELVHLALNSRNLERPINASLQGPSAGGKTYTVEIVLQFHPPDRIRDLTGSSERALAYTDFDTEHAVVIIGEASALHRDGVGASIIRSLAWGEGIRYETVEKDDQGQLRSRLIDKPGPTGLITTSTRKLDREVATRMLRITITDSPEQTRAVTRSIGREAAGELREDPDLTPWKAVASWLERAGVRKVVLPWATKLMEGLPVENVRMRRDARQIVMVVKASAFIHQLNREKDAEGRVVANSRDYATAHRLLRSVLAVSLDAVTPETREAVHAVERLNEQQTGMSAGVSYPELAEELGLSRSGAWRRAQAALEDGYLANAEERRGYPARLVTADPLPTPRTVLPSPEELFPDDPPPSHLSEDAHTLNAEPTRPGTTGRRTVERPVEQGELLSEEDAQYSGSLNDSLTPREPRHDGDEADER